MGVCLRSRIVQTPDWWGGTVFKTGFPGLGTGIDDLDDYPDQSVQMTDIHE